MLPTEPYRSALLQWPPDGRHILAHFDATTLVVYQAYNPSIAASAVERQRLGGGGFSFERMSWVKPNFLWMMYRSGWASKPGQERVLALTIPRAFFEEALACAVPSTFTPSFGSEDAWRQAVASSEVRLQWDPDHTPDGARTERRAIQIGLRGMFLRRFCEGCVSIEDVTDFVHEQARQIGTPLLQVPVERVLPVPATVAEHIRSE